MWFDRTSTPLTRPDGISTENAIAAAMPNKTRPSRFRVIKVDRFRIAGDSAGSPLGFLQRRSVVLRLMLRFQLGQDRLLRDGGAVGSRIGPGEVDSAFGVAHNGFAVAHGARE